MQLSGIDGAGLLPAAGPGEGDWPQVHVEQRVAPRDTEPRGFGGLRACFDLVEGRLLLERERRTITTVTEQPLPEDQLVHPWLGLGAGLWARWLGRDVFHGGAFVAGDGAWAVLGDREHGKSTLLAALAGHGHAIVTDDQLVLDDGAVFAGPRCVDLRPGAPEALGLPDLPVARGSTRRRLVLGPVSACTPLRGVVHLAWGDDTAVTRVPLAERIALLRDHNTFFGVPAGKHALLELAALPTVEFRRPRHFDALHASAAALLAALP